MSESKEKPVGSESIQRVNGDSLRIKHVAQIEDGDLRHVNEELPDVEIYAKGKKRIDWSWKDLTVAQTGNTIRTCRLCLNKMGGYILHNDHLGIYAIGKCPECKGTGEMKIE